VYPANPVSLARQAELEGREVLAELDKLAGQAVLAALVAQEKGDSNDNGNRSCDIHLLKFTAISFFFVLH
jgi:hypothetical protein